MYKDILESPDENDPSEYLHETRFESKYSSIKKSGKLFKDAAKQKGFSLLLCSLGKKVSLLHDILLTVETRPDVIAISETKINENSYANINLSGYNFVNTKSESQAGGIGFQGRLVLISHTRELSHAGLSWHVRNEKTSLLIGCIYQHPKNDRSFFL